MVYGQPIDIQLKLNGKAIERVEKYKSLGTILSTIRNISGNIYKNNATYLNERARNAIFGIKRKIKFIGDLPPKHMFYLYESMVEPILLYGSDLWGFSKECTRDISKIYFWFVKTVLKIQATTSNLIVIGESGLIPPEIKCHINSILYFIRLNSLPNGSVVKNVFIELERLHLLGYNNWYSRGLELSLRYGIQPKIYFFTDDTKNMLKQR